MLSPCPTCGAPCRPKLPCPSCALLPKTSTRSAVVLLGLTLAACNGNAVALYGVPDTGFVDADGDGFGMQNDCDDDDPEINPGQTEVSGDGIDSNCDGDDDT